MRLDKTTVMAVLASVGSRDPDLLRARARRLGRSVRLQVAAGMALVVAGSLAAFMAPGPAAGVPALLVGWWLWRLGARNAATVEAGFREFVQTPAS